MALNTLKSNRIDLSRDFNFTGALKKNGSDVLTSGTAVASFNGRVGAVTPQSGDYSKSDVGLGNVDNTSDATKNAATATLTNKTLTSPVINSPTGIVKGDVGLGNVDNTSDATKNSAIATLTNKTLTSPVINTPTGIVKGDVGLGNVDNTSDATKNSATATLTNKRITQRVGTVADAATITPTADDSDMYTVTALAQAATIAAPSGTPTNGQTLILRFLDNGTGRALTWNAIYAAIGVTLPATTTAGKYTYVGCKYNSASSKWDVLAVNTQA